MSEEFLEEEELMNKVNESESSPKKSGKWNISKNKNKK